MLYFVCCAGANFVTPSLAPRALKRNENVLRFLVRLAKGGRDKVVCIGRGEKKGRGGLGLAGKLLANVQVEVLLK